MNSKNKEESGYDLDFTISSQSHVSNSKRSGLVGRKKVTI